MLRMLECKSKTTLTYRHVVLSNNDLIWLVCEYLFIQQICRESGLSPPYRGILLPVVLSIRSVYNQVYECPDSMLWRNDLSGLVWSLFIYPHSTLVKCEGTPNTNTV